jgi:hypothetical protein
METNMRNEFLAVMWFAGLGSSACSSAPISQAKVAMAAPHETVLREDALNVISHAVCQRYETCAGFSSQGKYASSDDCHAAEHRKWAKSWSAEDCGGPNKGLLAEKVRECKERAEGLECNKNVLDKISDWAECGAASVCKAQKPAG